MLTPDELAAIPIFSTLSPVALADVARAAADIYLDAGEYAVYEGEPPALFVVLEGAIEVIKLVDGVERKLGMRLPGTASSARFRLSTARSFRPDSEPASHRGS